MHQNYSLLTTNISIPLHMSQIKFLSGICANIVFFYQFRNLHSVPSENILKSMTYILDIQCQWQIDDWRSEFLACS
jgi:hypothetical protein